MGIGIVRDTSDAMLEFDRMLGDLHHSRELYRDCSPSTYLDQITTPTLVRRFRRGSG